jgi:hypothetical protein
MELNSFLALKKRVESLKEEAARAKGALDQLTMELKKEFDCDTVETADLLAAKMKKKLEKAEAEYDNERKEFEKRFGNRLQ